MRIRNMNASGGDSKQTNRNKNYKKSKTALETHLHREESWGQWSGTVCKATIRD